jgi:amino acid transporter
MKKIPFFSLVMLIVVSIDNMKNLPAAALLGGNLPFFSLLSGLFFLFPMSIMTAHLAKKYPTSGGVYQWVHAAFGKNFAFFAIALQWINTMVWYPSMLFFIVGCAAFVIDPNLVEQKGIMLASILGIFWGLTWLNLKGIRVSVAINFLCGILGTILPLFGMIFLGALWIFLERPIQVDLNFSLPPMNELSGWTSLVALMASFLGVELIAVHIQDVNNPEKNFPRAIFLACGIIFITITFASLSMALVLPKEQIGRITGMMAVFTLFFQSFGMDHMSGIVAISIAVGSIGTMISWLISPAKGLFHAAKDGMLSKRWTRLNKAQVPSNILIGQAVLVSFFCVALCIFPKAESYSWFLTSLSTELYMIMYVIVFFAWMKLSGYSLKSILISVLGLFGTLLTIAVSYFPMEGVSDGEIKQMLTLHLLGHLILFVPFSFYC